MEYIKNIALTILANLRLHTKGLCLITGCPRSGTTALNEWLAKDKHFAGFNETRTTIAANVAMKEIDRFLALSEHKKEFCELLHKSALKYYSHHRVTFNKFILEKEPLEPVAFPDENYQEYIDNVRCLFTNCRIIFMIRDPLETIWSMFNRKWGYSLTDHNLHLMTLEDCIKTWNKCASVIIDNYKISHTFICYFNRLVKSPAEESKNISKFLSIKYLSPFKPRDYSKETFSQQQRDYIIAETKEFVNELSVLGIMQQIG